LEKSPFGIVGLETALPVLYTHLVKTGILSRERLIELLVLAPRKRFGIPSDDSFSLWRLDEEFTVDPDDFLSLGRATPYAGKKLCGVNYLTVANGQIVYKK
jgi:dihydroorotase